MSATSKMKPPLHRPMPSPRPRLLISQCRTLGAVRRTVGNKNPASLPPSLRRPIQNSACNQTRVQLFFLPPHAHNLPHRQVTPHQAEAKNPGSTVVSKLRIHRILSRRTKVSRGLPFFFFLCGVDTFVTTINKKSATPPPPPPLLCHVSYTPRIHHDKTPQGTVETM